MESSRCFPSSFHGSEHRGGIRLGLDAALRALARFSTGLGHGEELVRVWLGWFSRCLVFSRLFGAVWGCNVAFLRKCLSGGLSWVGPDELSGLTGKSVYGAVTCVLEACAVKSMGEECHGRRKKNPITARCAMMGVDTNKASIPHWVRRHENSLAISLAWLTGRRLTLADTHVRGAGSTDPTGDGGITGMPTPSHQRCNAICWGMPHQW